MISALPFTLGWFSIVLAQSYIPLYVGQFLIGVAAGIGMVSCGLYLPSLRLVPDTRCHDDEPTIYQHTGNAHLANIGGDVPDGGDGGWVVICSKVAAMVLK